MGVLAQLEPKEVFSYFETICGIPHGSGNTGPIADYLVQFAKDNGLEWYRDAANNVVLTKPASPGYEGADTIILQAHTDMVCEKAPGVEFDFTKDAIRPIIEDDVIRADGTTLGADDGISVAMILALLSDKELKHPKLEALLTSDEEIGLIGAFAFDCSHVTGHKLINLDSEYEGVLMCSCAGGANAYSTIPVDREEVKLQLVELSIGGLASGHSGVEIDKGRANSNVLMGRLLRTLSEKVPCRLVKLEGGSRETAIAAAATALVGVPEVSAAEAVEIAMACGAVYAREYAAAEPGLCVNAKATDVDTVKALSLESTARVIRVLLALPDSVQAMSMDMPGLVQTSINFGVLQLREDELYCANTVRSSMTTQKMWILDKVKAVVELAGGKTEITGSYPGWSYNPNSVVKDTILRAYKSLFGKEATVEAVHAGIECGLFADSIPNLDCVSIGPNMADVHTPREHVSISSTRLVGAASAAHLGVAAPDETKPQNQTALPLRAGGQFFACSQTGAQVKISDAFALSSGLTTGVGRDMAIIGRINAA